MRAVYGTVSLARPEPKGSDLENLIALDSGPAVRLLILCVLISVIELHVYAYLIFLARNEQTSAVWRHENCSVAKVREIRMRDEVDDTPHLACGVVETLSSFEDREE
jgi:hypothetical protein